MIEINTNRIHEEVRLIAGNDRLLLQVNLDPMVVMGAVNDIKGRLDAVNPEDEKGVLVCAREFATLIFGKDQAIEFMQFYGGDGRAALSAATKVFSEAIVPKMTAAQESAGRKSIRKRLKELLRK